MSRRAVQWWRQLRIQQKVWAVLLLLCVPLVGGLAAHLYIVKHLLDVQQQRHELVLASNHVNLLRRLAVDIEDGFRGYVLTQQEAFVAPLTEAESKIGKALSDAKHSLSAIQLDLIQTKLNDLLRSKHELIVEIQRGNAGNALEYVRSGEGLRLSEQLRHELRAIEDRLEQRRTALNRRAEVLSQQTFAGLWVALGGVLLLGWIGSRMLAQSITDPIMRLQTATAQLGVQSQLTQTAEVLAPALASRDELGGLARAYLMMARQISEHVNELEVLSTIGHEINTIGPDGLDGVLRRIADRAVELVQADIALVLLRNEQMGCWVVEAASGEWNDSLKNSVMLWEELPVSVRAFMTKEAAVGENFSADQRPEVVRRNLIGDSMLAVPLLSQGSPFGVLSLLSQRSRTAAEWNQRLAKGLAQEAALAISNARLYESAQAKRKGLLSRLRHLEHLAETLAHDLKGPGARMEELAKLLVEKFSEQVDERARKWLGLIQENGRDIVQRVEGLLEVARVGSGQGAVTAVDPRIAIDEVLKARAGEIERLGATIHTAPGFPLVACHRAYLRQIFDNLISNALKYSRPGLPPRVTISSQTGDHMVRFIVQDQGLGIPTEHRSRVFEPFVRLGGGRTTGSGIGLAIVQRIVGLYGGRIWIDGGMEAGCTVMFTLPLLRAGGTSPGAPGCTDESLSTVDGSRGGL